MKKLIITACLLIIFLFFGADAYAQKYTTIIYKYNQDSLKEDSFGLLCTSQLAKGSDGQF